MDDVRERLRRNLERVIESLNDIYGAEPITM